MYHVISEKLVVSYQSERGGSLPVDHQRGIKPPCLITTHIVLDWLPVLVTRKGRLTTQVNKNKKVIVDVDSVYSTIDKKNPAYFTGGLFEILCNL